MLRFEEGLLEVTEDDDADVGAAAPRKTTAYSSLDFLICCNCYLKASKRSLCALGGWAAECKGSLSRKSELLKILF
jgi:hypothetical protein